MWTYSGSPENGSDDGARADHGEEEWALVSIIAQVVVVDCREQDQIVHK